VYTTSITNGDEGGQIEVGVSGTSFPQKNERKKVIKSKANRSFLVLVVLTIPTSGIFLGALCLCQLQMARKMGSSILRHTLPFLLLPVLCPGQLVQCKAVSISAARNMCILFKETNLLLLVVELLPLCSEQLPNLTCKSSPSTSAYMSIAQERKLPKPASGFSVLIRSRQSWLKNM
jgi:hypothetical protein